MKKYTDKKLTNLYKKYMEVDEYRKIDCWPIMILFVPGMHLTILNFALLIRAAEGDL